MLSDETNFTEPLPIIIQGEELIVWMLDVFIKSRISEEILTSTTPERVKQINIKPITFKQHFYKFLIEEVDSVTDISTKTLVWYFRGDGEIDWILPDAKPSSFVQKITEHFDITYGKVGPNTKWDSTVGTTPCLKIKK